MKAQEFGPIAGNVRPEGLRMKELRIGSRAVLPGRIGLRVSDGLVD